ncbi:glycosyltransferase [Algoriphagus sp. CAU 1675]|uniref:glycosyltransferase n=1 Tax=Algoriphagus sp. CAU 1675 TaxID=3032597 RepID=UPI0023D9D8CE|nr:glycosyltransferase [Algoriphagus sp. CAU 1675]MDF2159397.1 glycosyltransferase [Algoriphagus sp. CAU 1675]
MIRILHCIETIASGGVEQVRLSLVRGLPKETFEHKIICTWKGGPIAEALEREGVELIPIGGFKHPFEWKKHKAVLDIIRKYKPHIIHGAIFEGMSMAAISGSLGRVPIRILEETSLPLGRSKKSLWLQKLFLSLSDAIIGISPEVGNFLKTTAGLPVHKIHLINNGVDIPAPIDPKDLKLLKESLGIQEGDLVLGSVGRLYDQVKRFSDCIKAVKLLDSSTIKFLVIGDGPNRQELVNLVNDLGLSDQVFFLGYQAIPHPYYKIMDVFCISSAHEGFGLVAAEAMMHGLPVIASRVGGLQDVVLDGETGFLVPPYSPESIAEKIQVLLKDVSLREKMGAQGKQRALEHYSAQRYCKDVESLYSELLELKGIGKRELSLRE